MIIMKFGGTLMGSAQAIQHSASLVAHSVQQGEKVVAVVSAMSGVTDTLIKVAGSAENGDIAFANDELALLRNRHLNTAHELGAAPDSHTVLEIRELLETLRQTVVGVYLLRELSPRSRDLIVSFGERLSAPLMAIALQQLGVHAHNLTGGQAGILTDQHFGNARPLPEAFDRIPARLEGLFGADITPVIAGFIGETKEGAITTLGRGGTDYTATIIGAALKADEVWAWKDVDGVMTTDPRMVPEAQNIQHLSYAEIMELAFFGAKVLHPLAVTPLQEHAIPLRVKSAADPAFAGTLITGKAVRNRPVKAVTAIRQVSIITVGGALVGVPETVAEIFDTLAKAQIPVLMISQSSSMANVSLVIQNAYAKKAMAELKAAFAKADLVRDFEFSENVAVVAIVGEGMRGARGIAAKLFSALAEEGINLLMISQGSSEFNISLAIEDRDVAKAVQAAHKAFELEKAD